MKISKKTLIPVFLSLILVLTFIIPFSTPAATGTLGSETPNIYCTFTDSEGEAVSGNRLSSGTYDVVFITEGMSYISQMQMTAVYDESIVTIDSVGELMSDSVSDMVSMGVVAQNGKLITGFCSTSDNTSSADADDQVIITLSVTINSEGNSTVDFAKLFALDMNPNMTFAESDYDDTEFDCYALVTSFEGYSANLYQMTADLSPAMDGDTIVVTGTTMQMMNTSGSYAPTGYAPGLTVTIGDLTATSASNGLFTVKDVPMDATTVVISGVSTVDRTITISASDAVDGVLDLGKLSILCCDYVKNGSIDAADLAYFKRSYMKGSSSYYVFADLNNSGTVDGTDLAAFKSFYNKRVSNIYSIFD